MPVRLKERPGFARSRNSFGFLANYWFRCLSHFSNDDFVFIGSGYEEDPPMDLPLEASDEPNRFFIQLYHCVATQVDLIGQRVLEVSCGHGGGASYLMRTLFPASYTGLDLNPVGVDFCRKNHDLPGLDFVQGDAQDLPFPEQSFDAVVNIEAGFCYPSLPRFLAEVARVLRPGGHFLYADIRRSDRIAQWEKELSDCPMRLISESVISEQVALGLEKSLPRLKELNGYSPAFLVDAVWAKACRKGLHNGDLSYRMYTFGSE
ncbi:hypothetical protein A5686_17955 [Mycobacterium sp. E2479]|nr:hypothetical protein A5686_17955 [Mycobacterium sp. E2479]